MSARPDTTSARIGEKLLAGWTLLADHCPRSGCSAPLLRSRAAQPQLYCPQHDGFVGGAAEQAPAEAATTYDAAAHEDERLGPFARPAAIADATATTGGQAAFGAGAPDARRTGHVAPDKQADVIAEYLLNGWTMLAEACPVDGCHAPLMWQKRDRKKFCPAHQLWVLTEEQAASTREAPPSAAVPREAPDASTPRSVLVPSPAAAAAEATPPLPAPPRVDDVAAAAIAAVYEKIELVSEMLRGSQTLSETRVLLATLTDCAAAVTALRGMAASV